MGEFVVSIFKSNVGNEALRLYDKEKYDKVNILQLILLEKASKCMATFLIAQNILKNN